MARTIAQALIINRQSLPKAIVHAYLTCVPLGTLRVVVCVAWSYPRVIISCDKNCSSINSWYSCFSRDKLQVPQSASAASTGVGLTRRARCGERDRGWAWNFAALPSLSQHFDGIWKLICTWSKCGEISLSAIKWCRNISLRSGVERSAAGKYRVTAAPCNTL